MSSTKSSNLGDEDKEPSESSSNEPPGAAAVLDASLQARQSNRLERERKMAKARREREKRRVEELQDSINFYNHQNAELRRRNEALAQELIGLLMQNEGNNNENSLSQLSALASTCLYDRVNTILNRGGGISPSSANGSIDVNRPPFLPATTTAWSDTVINSQSDPCSTIEPPVVDHSPDPAARSPEESGELGEKLELAPPGIISNILREQMSTSGTRSSTEQRQVPADAMPSIAASWSNSRGAIEQTNIPQVLLQSLLNNNNAFHAANNAEATTTTTINSPSPLLSYPQERLVSLLMQISELGGAINAAYAATSATSPHLTSVLRQERIMDQQLLLHNTSSSTPRNDPTPSSAEVPIATSTTDDKANNNADKSMKEEDD